MKLKAHIVFVTGLLFVLAGEVLGQGLCDRGGGAFTVTPQEGCSPLRVTIDNKVPNTASDGVGYVVTYDGNTMQGLAFSDLLPTPAATYSIPGEFIILQRAFTNAGRTLYHCEKVLVKEGRGINISVNSCGGGKVNALLTKDVILDAYDRIEINWGDGSAIEYWNKGDNLNLEHNYTNTTGSPIIKVRGLYTSGVCQEGSSRDVPVVFQQAQLEEIKITNIEMRQNGNLNFSFNGIGGIKTQVKHSSNGGNSYTTGGTWSLNGSQSYNISGLNIETSYKVKLSSEDNCAGLIDSDVVTSMVVEGESSGGSNKISWNKYDENAKGFQGYDLYGNGELLKSFSSIAETEYTDTDVECGEFVSYHIVARLTGVTSQSAPIGIRVENDLNSAITSAHVSVDQDKVLILAEVPGRKYTLNIERADNGSNTFKRIMSQNDVNEYQDSDVRPDEKSYCYRFSYESCDVKYPVSEPICTILLKKDVSVLSWSSERPFLDDLGNYTVSQTSISGVNVETDRQQNLTFSPQFNNQSELEYAFLVKATSQDGNFESLSNTITYRRGAGVFVPTAFTPNDDIYNNTLFAVAEQVKSFDFTIMNRWGNVVFHTSNLAEGWDGKIDGVNAAVGSYVYKIVFVDDIDQKVEKRGTFMLLR